MSPKNSRHCDIRVKMIIIGVYLLCAAVACQPASRATTSEVPPSSPISKAASPTIDLSITPTIGIPTPAVITSPLTSNVSMTKITSDFVRDLNWNTALGQFVYAYYDPAKSTDPIRWESFDPVGGIQAAYMPKQEVSDDLKRRLGVFRDYVSLSPSEAKLIYLRVAKSSASSKSTSAAESIEVWQADKNGLHSAKLGELPFLWDRVFWLDTERKVLLTISYESIDSGIGVFSFDLENKTSQEALASIPSIQGIPTGLSVSPNEKWIALTTYGEGRDNGVWIVDRSSNSARRIDSAYAKAPPLWSEDSRYIYYVHSRATYFPDALPSESPYLARYDTTSQSIQPLTTAGDIGIPLISQWATADDGEHFLFESDSGLGYLDQGLWSLTLSNR